MAELTIDQLFAKRLLAPYKQATEANEAFLAALFTSARAGDLCMRLEDPVLLQGAKTLPDDLKATIVCSENDFWYLRSQWDIEQLFIRHLDRLLKATPRETISIASLQQDLLNQEQKEAIEKALVNPLTLICGGPGTGKTFTAAVLIQLLSKHGRNSIFAGAPTGKAAANLREKLSSFCPVETVHQLLKKKTLFNADCIIIDEGSMLGAQVFAQLLAQVPTGSRLILLGDPDQLPPVETGAFFADLSRLPHIPRADLKTCLRTDLREIVEMAACVKAGKMITHEPLPDKVIQLLFDRLIIRGEKPLILSPIRHGFHGVDTLNRALFEKHMAYTRFPVVPFLITQNDQKRGFFNGDLGQLDFATQEARFSDGRVVPRFMLPAHEWAYVLSVHKSQGTESDEVILFLPEGAEQFGREMLYTAITRARKKIRVYGNTETITKLLTTKSERLSGLNFSFSGEAPRGIGRCIEILPLFPCVEKS